MGVWENFKTRVGLQSEPAPPPPLPTRLINSAAAVLEEHTPALTWQQRAIGFGICLGVGLLLSFLSLTFLWTFQITSFAVMYSFGSILSLLSTLFLMGPAKQLRNMLTAGRWLATLVYISSIIVTLAVAIGIGGFIGGILAIVFLVLQFLAMVWYCATYIPGGQELLGRCFGIKT